MTEAYSNPLQTIIDEFKNISPEITNTFIFKNDGQTIASSEANTEEQSKRLITNFNNLIQPAEAIGGIENLTIQATNSKLNIIAMDTLYLATVSLRAANPKIVKSLTQVVVPIVVRLVDQIVLNPSENQLPEAVVLEEKSTEESVLPFEDEPTVPTVVRLVDQIVLNPSENQLPEAVVLEEKSTEESVLPIQYEPINESVVETQQLFEQLFPKTPINQFMVEKIGGVLVPTDTVRIDGELITKWSELYDGKQITMVDIEALDGKKTTCKFKAIKKGKGNVKGIIQIPEKILRTLQTEKGKLVLVKPVIE